MLNTMNILGRQVRLIHEHFNSITMGDHPDMRHRSTVDIRLAARGRLLLTADSQTCNFLPLYEFSITYTKDV